MPDLEALKLDRADWDRERVIVRGKGDVERTAVITELARSAVERYLAARTDDVPPLFLSYSTPGVASGSPSAVLRMCVLVLVPRTG